MSKSALQEIKGGTTLYDSSSEDPVCSCDQDRGGIDGCNCVGVGSPPYSNSGGGAAGKGGTLDFSGWCPENDWCPTMRT